MLVLWIDVAAQLSLPRSNPLSLSIISQLARAYINLINHVPPLPTASAPPPSGQYATGVPMQSTSIAPAPWSSGLCDCFSDVPNCCLTCWCPCITFGQIAVIVDKGSTSCCVHGALYALINLLRGLRMHILVYVSIQDQYMLPESPCNDCLLHCCCEPCALCQEYRELQNRGFDISIGWDGNTARQNQGVAMPPVVQDGMKR